MIPQIDTNSLENYTNLVSCMVHEVCCALELEDSQTAKENKESQNCDYH